MSKLLYHGRTLKTTSSAVAARKARDTRVRTFKPTMDGTVRCTTCGVVFGEPHNPDCEPEPTDR